MSCSIPIRDGGNREKNILESDNNLYGEVVSWKGGRKGAKEECEGRGRGWQLIWT